MKGLNDMLVCKWWGYIIHILGYNGQEKDGLFSPTSLMFSHWCNTSQLLSNVFRHQKMGENKYEYFPYVHRFRTVFFLYQGHQSCQSHCIVTSTLRGNCTITAQNFEGENSRIVLLSSYSSNFCGNTLAITTTNALVLQVFYRTKMDDG